MVTIIWIIFLLTLYYYFSIANVETAVVRNTADYLIINVLSVIRPVIAGLDEDTRKSLKFQIFGASRQMSANEVRGRSPIGANEVRGRSPIGANEVRGRSVFDLPQRLLRRLKMSHYFQEVMEVCALLCW